MSALRVAGLLVAALLMVYAIRKYEHRRTNRVDLLVILGLSFGLALVALVPSVTNTVTRLLGLRIEFHAVLFISNIITFGLFLYTLNRANMNQRTLGLLVQKLAQKEYYDTNGLADRGRLIVVVIPAYNEERAILGVLGRIPQDLLGYTVRPLVIVDGASDQTEAVVRRGNYLVASHLVNRGQGDALRTGFGIAMREGADIVMTMDADGQHRPEDMAALVAPIVRDEADYVMGSRFLGHYDERGGVRHLGIVFFTIIINLLGGVKLTDCTNGFRAIRASGLAQLRLREDRFNAPELIMEAARKGLRIQEAPVTITRRAAGYSKKGGNIRYPIGFLSTVVRTWLR